MNYINFEEQEKKKKLSLKVVSKGLNLSFL